VNDIAAELTAALRERRAIIADEESRRAPEQHIERLKTVSQRIDSLAAHLPAPHPQLTHFLQRASYDKALEFLETSESTTRRSAAR
jgi:hypothetical protein